MPADLTGFASRARTNIAREAAEAHKQFRQYDGYWDGVEWFVVRFTRNVDASSGRAFRAGDVTIARVCDTHTDADHGSELEAYSTRTNMNTVVYADDCEEVL